MVLPDVLSAAHLFASRAVQPGGVAVDATIGNGHDTVMLAREVGDKGTVYGFDVQEEALASTRRRLRADGRREPVTLVQAGHEDMGTHIPDRHHGRVGAVTFNLGYLPGSDSACITRPRTTLAALNTALELLRPGGVVTIVAYTGHDGGAQETAAVEEWGAARPPSRFNALSYTFPNQQNDPPRLFAIEKVPSS